MNRVLINRKWEFVKPDKGHIFIYLSVYGAACGFALRQWLSLHNEAFA